MLDEGCVHILATDAHDMERRPPNLEQGREILRQKRVGAEEAEHLVVTRPMGSTGKRIRRSASALPGRRSAGAYGGQTAHMRKRVCFAHARATPAVARPALSRPLMLMAWTPLCSVGCGASLTNEFEVIQSELTAARALTGGPQEPQRQLPLHRRTLAEALSTSTAATPATRPTRSDHRTFSIVCRLQGS